jgi:hypothetical protein
MTGLERFRVRMAEVASERGLDPEGRSYVVASKFRGVAVRAARDLAHADRHPNPYHGSILHVEAIAPEVWEVVIGTTGGDR